VSYYRKGRRAIPGVQLSDRILNLALELHDLRDSATNIEAREKEVKEEMLKLLDEEGLIPSEDAKRRTNSLGVFRIWRKRGREYVRVEMMRALRDRLGDEAEGYIDRYNESVCISHLDPVGIERAIEARNVEKKI
jgi:hypothetical protein